MQLDAMIKMNPINGLKSNPKHLQLVPKSTMSSVLMVHYNYLRDSFMSIHIVCLPLFIKYLTSLRYDTAEASFNPVPKLIKIKLKQMTPNDSENGSKTNPMMAGIVQIIIPLRRPIVSETKPLSALPNGWPMYTKLAIKLTKFFNRVCSLHCVQYTFIFEIRHSHSHDASTGVMRIVSFGFSAVLMPSSAGITIDV